MATAERSFAAFSTNFSRILEKTTKPTFPKLDEVLSEEILSYLLPIDQVDQYGRHILVSRYPVSLSVQAVKFLHKRFQPILVTSNNSWFMNNRLVFGVPLIKITPMPRVSLEIHLHHDLDHDMEQLTGAITGLQFIPGLISMINGTHHPRQFAVPPSSSFMASITSINLEYRIDDFFRDSPNFLKYFDCVKGLRMLQQANGSQTEIRVEFRGSYFKDFYRYMEIRDSGKTPILKVHGSTTQAQGKITEGLNLLNHKQYAKAMLFFGNAANLLGRHICEFSLDFPTFPHLIASFYMVEIFLYACKAARCLGHKHLARQMLERTDIEISWMRNRGTFDLLTEFPLAVEIVNELVATKFVRDYEEAIHIADMFVARNSCYEPYVNLMHTVRQAGIELASSFVALDSFEGYKLARRILWNVSQCSGWNPEIDFLWNKWVRQYVRIIPHVLKEWMDKDLYGGYEKSKALISTESANFAKSPLVLQIIEVGVQCDLRLAIAGGMKDPVEVPPPIQFPSFSPERYTTELEKIILANSETAKGMGTFNSLKRKVAEMSGINKNKKNDGKDKRGGNDADH